MYFGGTIMTFALPMGALIVVTVAMYYLFRTEHAGPKLKYLQGAPFASFGTREPGPVPALLMATGQHGGRNSPMAIAKEQSKGEKYETWFRWQYSLTNPRGLFAVRPVRAAEQRHAQIRNHPGLRDETPLKPAPSPKSAVSDLSHRQAFAVLFEMAERQRGAGHASVHEAEPGI
jgi:hypothetical protein